jgi:hypothetical protein
LGFDEFGDYARFRLARGKLRWPELKGILFKIISGSGHQSASLARILHDRFISVASPVVDGGGVMG